jgi:4-aminobutyrate aminotransferase
MANAARMGDYIMKRTADWREKHKIVGEVRGKGLMIGIEFVRDQKTKEKANDLRNKLVQMAFHKGLLVLGSGDTTLRLCPPLLIDEAQADFALNTLEACITELERSL